MEFAIPFWIPLAKIFGIGDKDVIAHKLHLFPETIRQLFPSVPVIFCESVLQGRNRIFLHPIRPQRDHLIGTLPCFVGLVKHIMPVFEKLAGCWIEVDANVFSRLVAGFLNRGKNQFNRLFIGSQARSKSAFISHAGLVAFFVQNLFEGLKCLSSRSERFAETRSPEGHNHEFLEVDVVIRVPSTVEYIQLRDRQNIFLAVPQIDDREESSFPPPQPWLQQSKLRELRSAPSFALLGVPSSAMISSSRAFWWPGSIPRTAPWISLVTL